MSIRAEKGTPLPSMTEEEFVAWCDEDTRAEYVDGKVEMMSPVSLLHGDISDFLQSLLRIYLEFRPQGRKLPPEYIVRVRPSLRRLPDMMYVAPENLGRVGATYLDGPPDAVWEIVSPDSRERDRRVKYREYEVAGIREYWLVEPEARAVRLYRLSAAAKYEPVEEDGGRLSSTVVPGFWIRPEWLWQDPRPGVIACLREMGVMGDSIR